MISLDCHIYWDQGHHLKAGLRLDSAFFQRAFPAQLLVRPVV